MESTESKLSKGVDIDEEFNVVRVPVYESKESTVSKGVDVYKN